MGDDCRVVRRVIDLAKDVFHVASRGAERILSPMALWLLLWPLNDALAARYAWRSRDRVPAASLPRPVDSRRPSLFRRWRYFSRAQSHWWLLGWIDRLSSAKWQGRLKVEGFSGLESVLAERPVVVCSLHTTSVPTLAAWLRSLGLPTAHVPMDLTWFTSPARLRKTALAERMGKAFMIRPDSPRDMVEFLRPGNALVLTADFHGHRVSNVPWRGGSVSVSTGLFRLARSTGAAVVPVIILDSGRWRYEVTLFNAVPQDIIESGDTDAAARYVVECLMPLAAARPDQAMEVLVATVS